LVKEYEIDTKTTYFSVDKVASNTIGTTAHLQEGQVVSVYDLLRGLMLPSGNDAANCLAENFGQRLLFTKRAGMIKKPDKEDSKTKEQDDDKICKKNKKRFVKEMNRVAISLHLSRTQFANPHGLSDKSNHSTAFELAKLACHCMRGYKDFEKMVNTKAHNAITYLPIKKAAEVLNKPIDELQSYVEKTPF
jgi:D-alanyl-D-alanine carboxypeptidase (penicillin-binding protein 5/6)